MHGHDPTPLPPPPGFEGEPTTADYRPQVGGGRGRVITYVVVMILAAVGLSAFLVLDYLPMTLELEDLRAAAAERTALEERAAGLEAERDELREQLEGTRSERDELAAERAALARTRRQTESALEQLRERMQAEIEAGDILVRNENGEVSVDLASRILFDSGDAELSDRGKDILGRVADSLRELTDTVIQVGGHTDAQRPSRRLQEQYATNWELSTARATNVVRYLQDECRVPGRMLVAAGFAQFRPTATNRTRVGRRLNRRIELTLHDRRPRASAMRGATPSDD